MRILALALPSDAPALAAIAAQGPLVEAATADQADAWMADGGVDVLVTSPASWGLPWLSALPAETRPAVVLVGSPGERAIADADEWIADAATATEAATRLQVAVRRARLRRRAVRRGNVDPLTGLPNRRGVMVALLRGAARSRRQKSRLSLVLLDLDNFKRINEQQGHDAGDRVLRRVGRVLRRATRQDEVCGRVGGDEFVVVVLGDGQHGELVSRRVAASLLAEGVSATSAAAELGPTESLRELYRRVDTLLRQRKRLTRGQPAPGHSPSDGPDTGQAVSLGHGR
jgi:diguanylate cyclase (GGDEF)-like protein